MENVLTRLFQLPILPCTIAIANVRKFLHMSVIYSKASNLCYLLTVGWYTVAYKPNLYVCICTYDGIKVGLLYNNAGYVL